MTKRIVDVVIGAVLCVIALPVILVGAVLAMISLRTWSPFFSQIRIGLNGQELRFPKLRTLPQWMPEYGLKTEMRFDEVPRVARLLRQTHIDELPQLFLVVTGKMSLVGPRPKMPDAVEPVGKVYGRTRVQVPQGCTGLWQISMHKVDLPNNHPEYDLFYVANHSVRLDLWILWRTLMHGLRITKLITLADVPSWARRTVGTPVLQLLDLTDSARPAEPVQLSLVDEAR